MYGSVSVTSSATQILAANNNRKGFIIFNYGSSALYLGPDASITSSTAIPVLPNDSADLIGIFDAYRGNVYGITAGSTIDVRYWEWTQ